MVMLHPNLRQVRGVVHSNGTEGSSNHTSSVMRRVKQSRSSPPFTFAFSRALFLPLSLCPISTIDEIHGVGSLAVLSGPA